MKHRWLVYLGATLLIAGPLLAPGYVFALDHAMGPQSAAYYARYVGENTDPIQNKGVLAVLLLALTSLMPAWAAQKLILFVPFFLAGLGADRLASRRVGAAGATFAGLVYMLSPFAYIRGVAGQTGVLWAYALAPWFLLAWIRALDGSRRAFVAAALLAFATGVFQAHGLALLAILVAIVTMVRLAREPRSWRAHVKRPMLLAGVLLLLNASWIVPVALADHTTLDRIGTADRSYFQTTPSGMPSVGIAALTLQGFWRPGYEGPYETSLWLLAAPALVLVLAVHGLRTRRDEAGIALAIGGALGFLLAVAPATPLTAPLWNAAWDHVPILKGFREPHKFLALLALAYADHAAAGVDDLLARIRAARFPRMAPLVATVALLALPLASATPLMAGFDGQLGVTEYPAEWAQAEALTTGCDGSMLVLPWHLYMDQSWLPDRDKRVTDPAKVYFSCPIVSSDDVEAGGSTGSAIDPVDAYVARWLAAAADTQREPPVDDLGHKLATVHVRYVLVLKEADWRASQGILSDQRDLTLVLENARLQVWRNAAPSAAPPDPNPFAPPIPSWTGVALWTVSGLTLATLFAVPQLGSYPSAYEGGRSPWRAPRSRR